MDWLIWALIAIVVLVIAFLVVQARRRRGGVIVDPGDAPGPTGDAGGTSR